MVAQFGHSKYMPSPYSVYLSQFSEEVLAFLQQAKPFARYHATDKDYEVTPDVYEKARLLEETTELNSLPQECSSDSYSYRTNYPYQYQDDAVAFAQTHDNLLINFSQGMGKANVNGTIVKTPQGDRLIERLRVGDYVFGDDGKAALVLARYNHGNLDAYELEFSDGSRTRCLDNHIWTFYDEDKGGNIDILTSELAATFIPSSSQLQLPRIQPLEYSRKDLPVDPYVLGVQISRGGLTPVSEATIDSTKIWDSHFNLPPVQGALGFLFLDYLRADISQRNQLFLGLLGAKDKPITSTQLSYSTTSLELCAIIADLAEGLGHYCTVEAYGTLSDAVYIMSMQLTSPILVNDVIINPSSPLPKRMLKSISYLGKKDGVCITVDNASHLYLVDRHIPTHNTFSTLKILSSRKCSKILIITGVSNLQEEWLKDAEKHKSPSGESYKSLLNMHIVGEDPSVSVPKRIAWLKTSRSNQSIFTDLIGIESCRSEAVIAALNANHYDAIVVDEIQAAKGMNAEQTQGVHELITYPNQLRIALSGTPILNDPLEYYSVLRFLGVIYYKTRADQCSRSTFNKYYGEWSFDYWGHFVCTGYKNIDQLKALVKPILVHAPKSLLGLPEKHREVVQLTPLNPCYDELRKLYNKGSGQVKKAGYKTVQALAAQLQVMTSTDQSKLSYIEECAKTSRPLVFSQYTTVLDIVKSYLEEKGFKVSYYHGKLNSKERLAVLADWKAGNGDVLLLSISCARYGLNLQETQLSIFLEPPTSPAILEQAEDRLHRIGQVKEVFSKILLAGASDASDWKTIERKTTILM